MDSDPLTTSDTDLAAIKAYEITNIVVGGQGVTGDMVSVTQASGTSGMVAGNKIAASASANMPAAERCVIFLILP